MWEVLLYFQIQNLTILTIKLSYWIKKLLFETNIKYRGVLSEQSNWLLTCTLARHKFRLHYSTQNMAVLSMADLSVIDFTTQWGKFITIKKILKTDCHVFSPSRIVLVLSWVTMRRAGWSWGSDVFQSQCWEICDGNSAESRLKKKCIVVGREQEIDGSSYSWSIIISPL